MFNQIIYHNEFPFEQIKVAIGVQNNQEIKDQGFFLPI